MLAVKILKAQHHDQTTVSAVLTLVDSISVPNPETPTYGYNAIQLTHLSVYRNHLNPS